MVYFFFRSLIGIFLGLTIWLEKRKLIWKIGFTAGVNFINILRAAFRLVDPKSVKRYLRLGWVLMLWGAIGVKAACKYVDEIDPRHRATCGIAARYDP